MYNRLLKDIEYAKTSLSARELLFQTHGMIIIAFELNAITKDEMIMLEHECVCKGINNPKYF